VSPGEMAAPRNGRARAAAAAPAEPTGAPPEESPPAEEQPPAEQAPTAEEIAAAPEYEVQSKSEEAMDAPAELSESAPAREEQGL